MSFGVFPYMQDSPNTGPPTPHSVQVRRLLLPHEMYDAERYRYFNCILSPHSLEHLCATCRNWEMADQCSALIMSSTGSLTSLELDLYCVVSAVPTQRK